MKLFNNFKFNYFSKVQKNPKKENSANPVKKFDESSYKIYSQAISNQNRCFVSFGCNPTLLNETENDFNDLNYSLTVGEQRELIFDYVDGFGFEKLMAQLFVDLKEFGEVELTQAVADGGVDIIFNKNGKKTIVQLKKHNAPVSSDVVASLDYCREKFSADNAILIAASGVDDKAYEYAQNLNKKYDFKILNLDDVIKMANESGIELDEEYILSFSNEEKLKQKEQQKELIISLFNQGKTQKEIADAIGCCRTTIKYYLKQWGIEKEKTDIESKKDLIVSLFKQGKTQQEIAEAIGCSKTTIKYYLKKWGIERENNIERQKDLIISLFNQGKTQQEIAHVIGCGKTTIRDYLKKWGMEYQKIDVGAQKELIISLFNQGKTQQEIAEVIGCSDATIGCYLRQWGIKKENNIESQKELIISLFNQGKTQPEIAEVVGCHVGTIGKYFKQWGIEYEKIDIESQKDLIISLFNQGKTQQEIASEVGCGAGTIARYLKKWGIEYKKIDIESQKDLIISLFNQGKTQQEIASEVGCSVSTIGNYLRSWNIDTTRDYKKQPKNTVSKTFKTKQKIKTKPIKMDIESEKDLIVSLFKQGKTKQEIAELIGCCTPTIRKYLEKWGIEKENNLEQQKDLIILLLNQGKTRKEIAEIIGCNNSTIGRYLKQWGIEKDKIDIESQKDLIISLFEQGKTQKEIAEVIGCRSKMIGKHLKNWGIEKDKIDIESQKDLIISLFEQGKTYRQISEVIGCTNSTIGYYLKKWGVEYEKIDIESQKDLIISLFEQGKTYQQISEVIGCTNSTIGRYLKQWGIDTTRDYKKQPKNTVSKTFKTNQEIKMQSKKIDIKSQKDLIVSLFNQGKTQQEIADEIGCSQTTIGSYLKKWGIDASRKNVTALLNSIENYEAILKLSNRQLANEISKVYESQGYIMEANDDFANGMFLISDGFEKTLVKVVNSKNPIHVDKLRACASYLENHTANNLILIASGGVTSSKEGNAILDKYDDRLTILNLDDVIEMCIETDVEIAA